MRLEWAKISTSKKSYRHDTIIRVGEDKDGTIHYLDSTACTESEIPRIKQIIASKMGLGERLRALHRYAPASHKNGYKKVRKTMISTVRTYSSR